jgi:hypothetical protein
MEAGGHYYTVYYTSLAVGFAENVAFKQAVLAQMPDQVSWMDAAHMHIHQCTARQVPDFNNVSREVPVADRYRMEYGLHSLPNKDLNERTRSSAYQRQRTTEALLAESPVSLKFGLLLHRLGDTYAHSRKADESTMYTVNAGETCFRPGNLYNYKNEFGHGHDGHEPDYPFLRENLFYSYLENLHRVLLAKVNEKGSGPYKRQARAKPFHEVRGEFRTMFMNLAAKAKAREEAMQDNMNRAAAMSGSAMYVAVPKTSHEVKANMLIEEIRAASRRIMQVEMRKGYAPEREAGMPLPNFLAQQRRLGAGLDELNINAETLNDTINKMIPPPGRGGASGSW